MVYICLETLRITHATIINQSSTMDISSVRSECCFLSDTLNTEKTKRGRPLRYGNRINLSRLQFDNTKIDNKNTFDRRQSGTNKDVCRGCATGCHSYTPKENKPYRYFCMFTSDLACPVIDIVRHYKNRWQIETTFRDVKQHFGFDAYQFKQRDTLNRFVQLSFVAACLTQLLTLVTLNLGGKNGKRNYSVNW